jgi:nucleotide-binding universal stress UspA family protein
MERILVVIRNKSAATRELVHEAGEVAAGTGAELRLLHVMPDEEYDERMSSRLESKTGGYSLDEAESEAKRLAAEVGRRALSDVTVDYDVVGVVGHEEETILDLAKEYDNDHLFIAGRRRSPSGKALFGDLTQRILLNFDGMVTVNLTEER